MNSPAPLCKWCLCSMQLAESLTRDGKKVADRYICGCTTPPHQVNIHYGDQTRNKENE